MAEPARPEVRYTAFLSYSHKDAAAAGRLHRRLESYRLPKRLAGTESARGIVPERLWPIFRDREELPAATDLSETVREALAQSGSLIVLCSPHSAGSLWVAEEIETFRRLHPDRPILAAVLDGDPPDCFPAALRAFGQDGTWHEPLATDLRRGRDGAHLGLLKLVAGITGVGLDALVQRDAARKVRRVTAVTAVAVIAMLIMAALAWFALDARREAERQRAEAEGQIEFMLTDLREKLKGVGRLDIMTAVNRHALAYYERQQIDALPADSLERRARVLLAMGEDYRVQGNLSAGLAAFREAHKTTAEQLARAPNDASRIFAHSQSEFWLGRIPYQRRQFAEAWQAWQNYKRLADRLVQLEPQNITWRREAAYAQGNLCMVMRDQRNDATHTLEICANALSQMQHVYRLRPELSTALAVANRHAFVADAWLRIGRWDQVLVHRSKEEQIARFLIAREPENLDYQDFWMRCQFTFAELLIQRGQAQDARRWVDGAAATLRILNRRDPQNAEWNDFRQKINRIYATTYRGH